MTKWCNAGVDILASQPLDRFQSAEGAEKALKEIDEFLKKPQGVNLGKLSRMEKTAKELGDENLLEQVRMALKRISEVTEMMSNREARCVWTVYVIHVTYIPLATLSIFHMPLLYSG